MNFNFDNVHFAIVYSCHQGSIVGSVRMTIEGHCLCAIDIEATQRNGMLSLHGLRTRTCFSSLVIFETFEAGQTDSKFTSKFLLQFAFILSRASERGRRPSLESYTVDSVDERIVTAVAHCQPMATKKDDVDVSVPEKNAKLL